MLKSGDDNTLFFNINNNPNKINIAKEDTLYKFGLNIMIREQYFTVNGFYTYYGNDEHYDYINNEPIFDYYQSGFSKETLDDDKGTFYIIHPDELCFERNILGKIVREIESIDCYNVKVKNNILTSPKMESYWQTLSEYLLIVKDGDNVTLFLKVWPQATQYWYLNHL